MGNGVETAGAAAGEADMRIVRAQRGEEVGIQEFTAVIGMDLTHGEGKLGEEIDQRIGDDNVTAAQNGPSATPAGGHINKLEHVDVFAVRRVARRDAPDPVTSDQVRACRGGCGRRASLADDG